MTTRRTAPAQLETFYNVKQATVKLGIATEDPADERGQRWLRDGVNRKHNPFPHHRLGRQLMFSESDLAEIAAMHRNAPTRLSRTRKPRKKVAPKPAAVSPIAA
jgi:hypothetical protein